MSTEVNDFIKEIAKKHNLTYSQVERIFYSQFKFVAHVMSEDREKKDRRSVKIRRFGTFMFMPRMVEKLEKIKDGKREHNQTATED